jgi:hypothetical protein
MCWHVSQHDPRHVIMLDSALPRSQHGEHWHISVCVCVCVFVFWAPMLLVRLPDTFQPCKVFPNSAWCSVMLPNTPKHSQCFLALTVIPSKLLACCLVVIRALVVGATLGCPKKITYHFESTFLWGRFDQEVLRHLGS